jgi:quercetin dioxygenase-like cupin family protein
VIVARSTLRFLQLAGRASADPFAGRATEAMSVRLVRVDAGRRSPHRHPHSQEVIYVARGTGVLWEDGRSQPVGPGDCALIATGVPHAAIPDAGTTMELVCFFPHPDPDANIEELEDIVVTGVDDG